MIIFISRLVIWEIKMVWRTVIIQEGLSYEFMALILYESKIPFHAINCLLKAFLLPLTPDKQIWFMPAKGTTKPTKTLWIFRFENVDYSKAFDYVVDLGESSYVGSSNLNWFNPVAFVFTNVFYLPRKFTKISLRF